MSLSVVPEDYAEPDCDLPTFEGETVKGLRVKLAAAGALDLCENPHRIDQTVRLVVTGQVTRVDHVVNQRSGDLVRVETLKIMDMVEVDWENVAEYVIGR